jgi:hypothetical protein
VEFSLCHASDQRWDGFADVEFVTRTREYSDDHAVTSPGSRTEKDGDGEIRDIQSRKEQPNTPSASSRDTSCLCYVHHYISPSSVSYQLKNVPRLCERYRFLEGDQHAFHGTVRNRDASSVRKGRLVVEPCGHGGVEAGHFVTELENDDHKGNP